MDPLSLPDANNIRKIIDRIEAGSTPTHEEAMALVRLIYSIMTPDHTWWRPLPLPTRTILLAANDTVMTPPMVFNSEGEADFFQSMNKTLMYLPIPKPPCLNMEEKK
jgi:hypothetical protein